MKQPLACPPMGDTADGVTSSQIHAPSASKKGTDMTRHFEAMNRLSMQRDFFADFKIQCANLVWPASVFALVAVFWVLL